MLASCFAVMPNLRQFVIEINVSYLSDRLPLPTRVVLPSLTSFHFMISSDYLEELLAQIDAPILYCKGGPSVELRIRSRDPQREPSSADCPRVERDCRT